MKDFFTNVVKGYITTVISIVIYVLTSILIWKGTFDFLWEGVGGYVLGTVLLLAPQTFEGFVNKWLDNKKDGPV